MTLTHTSPVGAGPRQHDRTWFAPMPSGDSPVRDPSTDTTTFTDTTTAVSTGTTVKAVTVPLRVAWSDYRIKTIPIVVADVDDLNCEIRCQGQVLGFIHRAGRVFVALRGTRLDRAEECGQSLLWDIAAGKLVTACSHFVET
ncbi:MAG: hypothetical protein ABI310_04345 [Microbacteriaceae bacterium]